MGLRQQILSVNPIYSWFKYRCRTRLKNNVTILASNCLGGFIYHDLGTQFISPTINTRFDSPDFVNFVCNIDYYLDQPLAFIPTKEPYPVAKLGDLTVNFVHYPSAEVAETKWKERIIRIDWDHVFVLLNDNDGMTERDFAKLDACRFKNVLVFTARSYPQYRCTYQLPIFSNLDSVGNTMLRSIITGKMVVQKYFDFVQWFNNPEIGIK